MVIYILLSVALFRRSGSAFNFGYSKQFGQVYSKNCCFVFLCAVASALSCSFQAHAQDIAFDQPVKLPTSVNSEHDELYPLLTAGGGLYFVRTNSTANEGGVYARNQVWRSDLNAKDAAAKLFLPSDWKVKKANAYSIVGIADNGKTVFLLKNKAGQKVKGVYFSKIVGTQWTKPELVSIPGLESLDFFSAYVSPDFEVMLFSLSQEGGFGQEDIYVSFKAANGEWSKIRNLGSTINTEGFEMSPFLSDDKTRLFFSSSGHGAVGGADVFVSERLYNSWETWSVPKKLPAPINSASFDAYFSLYGDSVCYFASDRGGKSMDIYRSMVLKGTQGKQSEEDVSKLIEDSKAILSEIRGEAAPGTEPKILRSEVISITRDEEIRTVATQFNGTLSANTNAKIYLLANTNSATRAELVKISELFRKAGVSQSQIEIPAESPPLHIAKDQFIQRTLEKLERGQALIVLYDR